MSEKIYVGESKYGRGVFAKRDIVRFKYRCFTKNCRGVIRGYRFLYEGVKNSYKSINLIPSFLLNLENGHCILND